MIETNLAAFEETLAAIDRMIDSGEDVWIMITEAAHEEETNIDIRRWRNCDLASRVSKKYGDEAINKFASDANLPVRRAQEYRTMGKFYADRISRADFLEQNPIVTYSHMRSVARKANGEAQAYRILEKVNRHSWTIERTEYFLMRWQTFIGNRSQSPRKLADLTVPWHEAAHAVTGWMMANDAVRPDQVRITIHEAPSAPPTATGAGER